MRTDTSRRRWIAAVRIAIAALLVGTAAITGCQLAVGPAGAPSKDEVSASGLNGTVRVGALLNTPITDAILVDLARHGAVEEVLPAINVVVLQALPVELAAIRALPYMGAASPERERKTGPVDTVLASDFSDGVSTWDLDSVNVTDFGRDNRSVKYDGDGVYVAVLDTGLLHGWRRYFPQERIAVEYARSFVLGGSGMWEWDTNSHGTHVTSTIIGYSMTGAPVNGVAPMARIIPVKVLNNNGSGSSVSVALGIVYVANLKAGPLADSAVVINMSLGGPELDAVESAAIDYAISKGVIIVAAAGNEGTAGMGYPGAYEPVISVAASGWIGEWQPSGSSTWWYDQDVADPTSAEDFYITDFSSRELSGQDLDVAAPGSWVLGPYQVSPGRVSYYFLGGTSMASPHVAGIVALMAQKDPALLAADAESILERSALSLAPGSRSVTDPDGAVQVISWGSDATGAGLARADAALDATP